MYIINYLKNSQFFIINISCIFSWHDFFGPYSGQPHFDRSTNSLLPSSSFAPWAVNSGYYKVNYRLKKYYTVNYNNGVYIGLEFYSVIENFFYFQNT